MATVDSLDIQISASVAKANASLDSLVNRLSRVSASLAGVNSRGLATMGSGINKLSNAMANFNANTKTADFTRLAKNFQQLANVDFARLQGTSSALSGLASSLSTLNASSQNISDISNLVKNINKFGNASTIKAMDNMPRLAMSLTRMMNALSHAPRVSNNLINMTNALANFARTGASGGRAATSLAKSFNVYGNSVGRATKKSFSLSSAIGKMYATYFMLFRAMRGIGKSIDYASQITEVQNVVDNTFGTYIGRLDAITKDSITQLGMSELTVKKIASTYQAMGKAMGFAQGDMADMSVSLTKLTADMASFYDVEQKAVAEDLQSIFTGQTKPLRQYGLDLTEATLKEYALKNGLDANLDSMTQMQKAMLRYQYVMDNTKVAQGDFAKTSNTWANQIRILKENFVALGNVIGRTFIAALKPMVQGLNSIMQVVIRFAELVSNALGQIFGWKFENPSGGGLLDDMEGAEDAAGGIADNIGGAADKAKKLKQQLQGIDELNVLSSDKDNGSGGGSGANVGGGGSQTPAWTTTETIFDYFKSSIKDLGTLGTTIRDSLIDTMGSIEWDKIYDKAKNFGSGLASFLNGLFSNDKNGKNVFSELGGTIAGALNTGLTFLDTFFDDFDFKEFGKSFSSGLNKFFKNFKWDLAADVLNGLADGIIDAIGGFLGNVDGKAILDGLSTFFGKLQLDTILLLAGYIAFKTGFGAKVAKDLIASIGTAFTSSALFTSLSTTFSGAFTLLASDVSLFGAATFAEIGVAIFAGVVGAIAAAFVGWNLGKWLSENNVLGIGNLADTIVEKSGIGDVATAFTDPEFWKSVPEEWKKIGSNAVQALKDGITTAVANIGTWIQTNVIDKITGAYDSAKEITVTAKGKVEDTFTNLKTKWDSVVDKASQLTASAKEGADNMLSTIKGKWDSVVDKTTTLIGKATDSSNGVLGSLKSAWNLITDKTSKLTGDAKNKNASVLSTLKNSWQAIVTKSVTLKASAQNKSKTVLATLKKSWDAIKSKTVKLKINIAGTITNLVNAIKNFVGNDTKALGGSFYNGKWHEIAQYANGGFPSHGSMFIAGEAGAEVVGHIGGRTEVLNESQLASTMYQSVANANAETNALLRRQNELLLGILEKDTGISYKDVFNATRRGANEYQLLNGRKAF